MKYLVLLALLTRVAFADEPEPTDGAPALPPSDATPPAPAPAPAPASEPAPAASVDYVRADAMRTVPPPEVAAPEAPVRLRPSGIPDARFADPLADWPTARFAFDLRVFGQARWTKHDGDDLTQFVLDRGEVGGTLAFVHDAFAELRLETVRSAGDGGALGVDGDSLVARAKYAQVGGRYKRDKFQIDGAIGLVPDPWIRTLEIDDTTLALGRTGSEELLGWPTADVSGLARVSYGPARLSVAVGNGEGLRYPERNQGKTTTAVLDVGPFPFFGQYLKLSLVGRDGSLGPASIRDRRAGCALMAFNKDVAAGAELVRAWGIGDRGDTVGTETAIWGRVGVSLGPPVLQRFALAGRFSSLELDGGGSRTSFTGALSVAPWGSRDAELRLWLAVGRETTSGNASPLPGTVDGDATTFMLIASATARYSSESP